MHVTDPRETPAGVLLDRIGPGDDRGPGDPGSEEAPADLPVAEVTLSDEPSEERPPRPPPVFTPRHKMMSRGDRPPKPRAGGDDLEIERLALRVALYAGMLSFLAMMVGATALILLRGEWMALLGL